MTRKAFTLIELLVVIAIIAILAAILFPVFAQAKAAAKKTQEISNAKNLGLGVTLYSGDNDDVLPISGTINGAWATGYCNAQIGCPSWDKLMFPYTKNWQILDSPLDRSQGVPTPFGPHKRSFRAAQNVFTGLTGFWWAPADVPKPPRSMTAFGDAAGTIMLTNQRNETLYSGTWWPMSTWFENWVWGTTSENTRPNNFALATPNAGDTTPDALGGPNNYWRGVDVSNGPSTYVFLDGHAKAHAPGFMFPGYRRTSRGDRPDNPLFNGVCLSADQWSNNVANDCPTPP